MFSSNTSQVSGGYEIQRSLRFNSADSAYLNRTPASAGNRRTWTWSAWVKRSALTGLRQGLLVCVDSAGNIYTGLEFNAADQLVSYDSNAPGSFSVVTTQVFRDVSAWYHIVWAYDTTQATASNRVKIYVNGSQVTNFATADYPTQNSETRINTTNSHSIGSWLPAAGLHLNGYITEVNFIDGQALTPSSFGEINADTGVWQPKRYAGSYGTNGFYLNFSNNSNTTAATLGADYSGNGNNWTPNNFSVSAGAGNDSLVDSPTSYGTDTGVGGSVRGNYATLNPLQISTTYATISNGNLQYVDTTAGGSYRAAYSTIFASSGKYYFEATVTSISGAIAPVIGLVSPPPQNDTYIEQTITGYQGYGYQADGQKSTNDTYTSFGATYTTGDTVSVAVDIDAGKVWFAKNGTWQASGDPAAGTNTAFSIVAGRAYGFAVQNGSSTGSIQMDANFGQRPFAYTAPSGFKALTTQNLPIPTIGATPATQAGKFFNPVLWTGTGTTQNITGVGFESDFVWMKNRSVGGRSHYLFDRLRGITNARLFSNLTDAESTSTTYINSTNSDGYQLASGDAGSNGSGETYVGWNWKANGAGVTNTAGTITSTVSANTTSGFSVVTYTGNGTSGATVGHGLGVAPRMIIVKSRSATASWVVYHASLGATQGIFLNLTDGAYTGSTYWNNTTPSSSVFTLGTRSESNSNGETYVAYAFAEVPGYSRFGSFVGNGSADGPFVFCGFRPRYILFKTTDNLSQPWGLVDTARSPSNLANLNISPTRSDAENSGFAKMDILSNGFKIRETDTFLNGNGNTYIFAAFAEAPQKFALAR